MFPGTNDFRLILRPVITIRVIGPKVDARWDALVDSGADETLFPLSLAEALGIELDQQMTSEAASPVPFSIANSTPTWRGSTVQIQAVRRRVRNERVHINRIVRGFSWHSISSPRWLMIPT